MSMFSDINNILRPMPTASDPRTAETDARQEIIRHDPEQERHKKGGGGNHDAQGLFGDDQADISVESLGAFLNMLLKEYMPRKADEAITKPVAKTRNAPPSPNAQAAGAYARMAHYQHTDLPLEEADVEIPADAPGLNSSEVQRILALQKEVHVLVERHIHMLTIQKADTFLESLENAVRDALR